MASDDNPAIDLTEVARELLLSLQTAGVEYLPFDWSKIQQASTVGPTPAAETVRFSQHFPAPLVPPPPVTSPVPPQKLDRPAIVTRTPAPTPVATPTKPKPTKNPPKQLPTVSPLQLEVEACEKCTSLSATRIKPIFGQGSSKPVILFLGDSPIAEEDRKSQLFVDEAGELFQKMMVACGLTPEEIYITTALKCRLPGSREAKPQERENCRGYLEAQIMELQPQAICCFGESASRGLLNSLEEWNSLRAGKHQYIGFPVYCTYHPRTLLKNANLKRDTWDDLRRMLKDLGRAVN